MIVKSKQRLKHLIFSILLVCISLLLIGIFNPFHSSVSASGLPGRITSAGLTCSVNGALSKTTHEWWDYSSSTTGKTYNQIFKYESNSWVYKGKDNDSATGSSGYIISYKGSYEGAGANFQVRGRSWINNSGLVDITRERWCS